MSSQSDSQDISREPSTDDEVVSDVESISEPSTGDDAIVAMEMQKVLVTEAEAEDFEQVMEDEELALAVQTVEEEEEKERMRVTIVVLPPRDAGEASSSRPLNPTPLRAAPEKKKKTKVAAPKKKGRVVDQGKPVDMLEGYSFLNTAALEITSKADRAEFYVTQLHVGPSATVVEPRPEDVLFRAPEGCIAVHILSVSMGLKFSLHPFLREYLRYVGLVPCQLNPNSHSYITGFLNLCRLRGWPPVWTYSSTISISVGEATRMPRASGTCSS
ncbi:unnamed protein product [Cuscuta europaea]|uniref:Transposase (putative) gypsy type domain-containing protein n=1 Tax=Cuscuta europaea TaxID=41803 RepID=A0A9P1A0D6_CUSEU|nr:unnamed protein product [Cuscuta europaea]